MFESDNFQGFNQQIAENEEQFAAVLNALLPEIEKQLMKDIERQLQSEFQQKYLKTIQEIDSQALKQYQQALLQLQESRHLLQQQKNAETHKEIHTLQTTLASLQEDALLKMQKKFLQENFDEKIMTNQRILELEKQIQEEIFTALDEKHQLTKQRQLKELIIAHETKQIRLRKQLDLQIKSRIYCSSGLEELKQQIKQSRTQMGSQKSEYNLKLKKIQTQIKEYHDKIKDIQRMGDVQKLREKYEELKVDLIEKQTEKQLENDEKNRNKQDDEESVENDHRNDDSLDEEDECQQEQDHNNYKNSQQTGHQYSNSKTLKRQQRNSLLAPQFVHKQQKIHDQDDFQSQQFVSSQNNRKKFDLAAYFKGYLLNSQTAKITESQNYQQDQQQKKTLLNLGNLSEILKQKVSMDPLQRYLKKQNAAEQNDMNWQNSKQKTSNFAELYEQHLKNLNKGFGKKSGKNTSRNNSAGLSDMAKKTIIKNLALHHRNNFAHPSINNKSSSTNSGINAGTENFNSYESNLLRSSK